MMKMKKIITLTGILGLLLSTAFVMGDNDRYERGEHKDGFLSKMFSGRTDVAPVQNTIYKEECGSCHFAYQPGLLPARSWQKIMGNLENHFQENAELDQETQASLTKYLIQNAADRANYKRSKRIMRSLSKNATPLRITKTPYFIRKHDEVPRRIVQGNPKVGSFSNCSACHTGADKGMFDEDSVRIPGVGRWDD